MLVIWCSYIFFAQISKLMLSGVMWLWSALDLFVNCKVWYSSMVGFRLWIRKRGSFWLPVVADIILDSLLQYVCRFWTVLDMLSVHSSHSTFMSKWFHCVIHTLGLGILLLQAPSPLGSVNGWLSSHRTNLMNISNILHRKKASLRDYSCLYCYSLAVC
jgi:hypothetical protein